MKQLVVTVCCTIAFLSAATVALADAPVQGNLTGQFKITAGTPMSGAIAYFYNLATGPAPSRDRYWRVPDHIRELDKDGRFTIQLVPGDYNVGVIKRHGAAQIGPPQEGDVFLLNLDGKGKPRKITVKSGETVDMGAVSGSQQPAASPASEAITAIAGTVQDSEGKPVEGALVFAYISPTMVGKPLFVSERSGKDGSFLLRVHEGGTYYLKLRNTYGGGPPFTGAVQDGNKEEPLPPAFVKSGETVRGIVLKGKLFTGRGQSKKPINQ